MVNYMIYLNSIDFTIEKKVYYATIPVGARPAEDCFKASSADFLEHSHIIVSKKSQQ